MDTPVQGIDYIVDHYQVLEVGQDASPDQIRSAFQQQQRLYHPDNYRGKAEEVVHQLRQRSEQANQSYEVLSHPEARAVFDQLLATWDGPVSKSGTPIVDVRRAVFSLRKAVEQNESLTALNAKREARALQISQYDQAQLYKLEQAIEGYGNTEPPAIMVELYQEALERQAAYLSIKEELAWAQLGQHNYQIGYAGQDYAEQIEALIADAHQQAEAEIDQLALMIASGQVAAIGSGQSSVTVPTSVEHDQAVSLYRQQLFAGFEQAADTVRQIATQRQAVAEKRLDLVKGKLLPPDQIPNSKVLICLRDADTETVVYLAFEWDGSQYQTTAETASTEQLQSLSEPTVIQSLLDAGWNMVELEIRPELPVQEQLERALEVHYDLLHTP